MAATTLSSVLAWLGGAALALVTLRRGPLEGVLSIVAAAGILALVVVAMNGNPVISGLHVLEYWGPIFLLAWLLRVTVSLPLTLSVSLAGACLVLLGFHTVVADTGAFWQQQLGPLMEQELEPRVVNNVLPVLSGYWMLGLWALVVGSLLLGRWWQALLYNPGGFGAEFQALRLDWRLAGAALALMLGAAATGPGLVHDLALVAAGGFTVQALAVAHAVRATAGWHWAAMVPVYLLLPLLFQLYALVAIADSWLDIRRRQLDRRGDNE